MLPGWASRIFQNNSSVPGVQYSLVRTALFVLLILSLLPLLLVGSLSTVRTRGLLRTQINTQLENITTSEIDQVSQYVTLRERVIESLVSEESFQTQLAALFASPAGSADYINARSQLYDLFRSNPGTAITDFYQRLIVLSQDGQVILSSDAPWAKTTADPQADNDFVRSLIGSNQSVFAYLPEAGYGDTLTLFTARSFTDPQGQVLATLIATASSTLPATILVSSRSFLPGAMSYFYTSPTRLLSVGQQLDQLQVVDNPPLSTRVNQISASQAGKAHFETSAPAGPAVFAYAQWIAQYQLGVILTVPQQVVFAQTKFFDPLTLALLGISLLLTGTLLYIGSTQLFRPILQLAQTATSFSKGNWTARAEIQRKDEIGLLAASFNQMADDLSQLYTSLESVVQKRTRQLRIAAEVAQLSTTSTQVSDVLSRTVDLIADRFNLSFVAIYLVNETGRFLVLREASGAAAKPFKQRANRFEINQTNLISWVARYNQPKTTARGSADGLFQPDDLLPETQCELAVPIANGSEILGVLDIHSSQPNAFDSETISIFQTIAFQVSSSLQNTRLVESTHGGIQENTLLYRVTRQVAQAQSEAEINQYLTDTLSQLPLVSAILTLDVNRFKLLVVTDPKTGRVEKNLLNIPIPAAGLTQRLVENRTMLFENIAQPSEYENFLSFFLRRGCKSAALVSILENGQLSRVLAFGAADSALLNQADLQSYLNLADIIGAMLEKFRLLSKLQLRVSELQFLNSFSQTITIETNLQRLFEVLHQQAVQMLGPDLEFAVALYNQSENLVQFPYFYEQGHQISIAPFLMGEGLTSQLIQKRKPLLLPNEAAVLAQTSKVVGRSARSWMGIPLLFSGSVVGAILIQDLEHENRFNEDDLNLFNTLAPQIAIAVRNTELYTQATDALRAYDLERFLLNTLLDHMPEAISFKDARSRYIRVSTSLARRFALDPTSLVGKTDADLIANIQAEEVAQADQRVIASGAAEIGRIEPSSAALDTWAQTSRIPVFQPSGDLYGLLTIQQDITELKQAEALAQRRADQVTTAAEIARDTTGTLDVSVLLQKSVALIRERFNYYHASLFIVDLAGEYALLRASTGSEGKQVLQPGYRLALGSKSIIGQVCAGGKALIVSDVTLDPFYLPDPLLPETRSELAIPLMIGRRVLGALDVQSSQVNSFHEDDVKVLQVLADQLAVAIANAELFAQTRDLLVKHRLLRQVTIAASSSTNLEDALLNVASGLRTANAAEQIVILLFNPQQVLQVSASAGEKGTHYLEIRITLGQGITTQAAAEKHAIRVDDIQSDPRYIYTETGIRSELAVPILFGEEILGVLNLESSQASAFNENDEEIIGALGSSLGGIIANIRLVNQVRQQIQRERQLYEVTSKIRRSVDLETILETSAQEIARATGARRARIHITAGKSLEDVFQAGEENNGRKNGRQHTEEDPS